MEIKKDPFGKTSIYSQGVKRGEITPDKKIIDMFGRQRGTYLGGGQAKDKYGFVRSIIDIIL